MPNTFAGGGTERAAIIAAERGEEGRMSERIEQTLRFLRDSCPPEGYLIAFSGGKDSLAVVEACKEARVPYSYYYKVTTVDPPELVKYIKHTHPKCVFVPPPKGMSMYKMAERKGVPTRWQRWCCAEFKEYGATIEQGSVQLLGIRATESKKREKNWQLVNACMKTGGYKIAPCLHWTDEDVWEVIRAHNAPYCELYDQGCKRIGCIGCPQADKKRFSEFDRWPYSYRLWRRAAMRYLAYRRTVDVPFIAAWPGWLDTKSFIKTYKAYGADPAMITAYDAEQRAKALAWQDKQPYDVLAGRIMAWWMEARPEDPRLVELESYAISKTLRDGI